MWFLPLGIHAVTRTIFNQQSFQKCTQKSINQTKDDVMSEYNNITVIINSGMKTIQPQVDMGLRRKATIPLPTKVTKLFNTQVSFL